MEFKNITLELPNERVETYPYEIENGRVTIYRYEDETVVVKIQQDGKDDLHWVNRQVFLDPVTGNMKIVKKG
ncbi:hypothetical protein D3C74_172350 [compost metagenome]